MTQQCTKERLSITRFLAKTVRWQGANVAEEKLPPSALLHLRYSGISSYPANDNEETIVYVCQNYTCKLPTSDINQVAKIFNEAKKNKFGYEKIADQIGFLFSNNKLILEELLNNLFFIAEADGNISVSEIEVLKSISHSFNLNENDFQRIFNSRLNDKESDPYKVLGANRDDSDDDIRNKWILLTKEHHPDNLIAKGMPQEFVDQANKELSAINLAYDKIKKYRGIN